MCIHIYLLLLDAYNRSDRHIYSSTAIGYSDFNNMGSWVLNNFYHKIDRFDNVLLSMEYMGNVLPHRYLFSQTRISHTAKLKNLACHALYPSLSAARVCHML